MDFWSVIGVVWTDIGMFPLHNRSDEEEEDDDDDDDDKEDEDEEDEDEEDEEEEEEEEPSDAQGGREKGVLSRENSPVPISF